MKNFNDDYSLSNAMSEFIIKSKLRQGLNAVNIKEVWFKVMENISNYTTAVELKKNTLYVALNSAIVRQELQLRKPEIIAMLNAEFGEKLVYDLKLQ